MQHLIPELQKIIFQRQQDIQEDGIERMSEAELDSVDVSAVAARYGYVLPELDFANEHATITRGRLARGFTQRSIEMPSVAVLERKDISIPIKGDFAAFQPLWSTYNRQAEFQYTATSIEIKEYIFDESEEAEKQTNRFIQEWVSSAEAFLAELRTYLTAFNNSLKATITLLIEQRKQKLREERTQQEADTRRAKNWRTS